MKRFLLAAAIAAIAAISLPVFAEVGVSINIGQPAYYGQLDVGDYPRPQYYNPRPVVITRSRFAEPVYLRVPPGHRRHWARHCAEYNACGRQAYFVQDRWYNDVYVPQYRERNGYRDNRGNRDGRGWNDNNDRNDNNWREHPRKGHDEGHRRYDRNN